MRLHEIKDEPVSEWLAWIEEHWDKTSLKTFRAADFSMGADGRIDSADTVNLDVSELKFPFGSIGGDFEIYSRDKSITSMKNFPRWVGGSLLLSSNSLTTVEGLPSVVDGGINLSLNPIASLQGIHKHLKRMRGTLLIPTHVSSHVLGVILITGCVEVDTGGTFNGPLMKALKIINKHLGHGKAGVLAAQQELLDAGLDDYAQL